MDAFKLRRQLISDYAEYSRSFVQISDPRIRHYVDARLEEGVFWPEPLIQLNPRFEWGEWLDELVDQGLLHDECRRIFRIKSDLNSEGKPLRLYRHQAEAIRFALGGHNYVLTTGTGSGKSLAFFIPIIHHVLQRGSGQGIQAVIVYPMNALANSQLGELEKYLCFGYPEEENPVTFARYTGQESDEERQQIMARPPDILLTNYVMLELILTRPDERNLIEAARGLQFLVLDELHTYRGRQGADVALLVRRTRDRLDADELQCVGTSATLAGPGSMEEQQAEVARVSSLIFGAEVQPEHVVGEYLQRITPLRTVDDRAFRAELNLRVRESSREPPDDYQAFISDPLSIWLESTFGVCEEPETGRLIRASPKPISGPEGAAVELSRLTGVPVDLCVEVIEAGLLGGYRCRDPEADAPVFAFRLHQFISKGDTVYASVEPQSQRHLTLDKQQYVPNDRTRVLLPLVFCRECGQEYYCVRQRRDPQSGQQLFEPRELSDRFTEGDGRPGFLFFSSRNPWPTEAQQALNRLPDDWLEDARDGLRVRANRREYVPQPVRLGPGAREAGDGVLGHFVPAPFRFCLNCGVSYGFRQASDFAKLSGLGSEGRSTATTILALSLIRQLRAEASLPEKARKLLSFTDNRQDASLQAGHFNDFVEIGLLRGALFKACTESGPEGLTHDVLTQRVFAALNLPLEAYAADPQVRFQALEETQRALRDVIGYRLYRDLQRGWRITSPNLEQCGLLTIQYASLEELCRAEDVWGRCHPALESATPDTRAAIAKTLLDFMRRSLAIKVDYLNPTAQERIQQRSSQRLVPPWALDEEEKLEPSTVLFPRPSGEGDDRRAIYLSPRGGFGQYLRRRGTFPDVKERLTVEDTQRILVDLLEALRQAGLAERVVEPRTFDDVAGYQVPASALRWVAGDGTQAFHDPIRVPSLPESGIRSNPFFVRFYREIAGSLQGIEAREHTAQVQYEIRQEREERFRAGKLPVLFCSPTMELGIDIAELNAVNMRNIPPTPANYVQRSGRAGRSGQPALVFSYCSTGSSHDQYFFKRPERMVAGAVAPPRLDLANEDLVRAHVHAIWLAETGVSLGKSLRDVLDLSGEAPSLEILPSKLTQLDDPRFRQRARERARRVLFDLQDDLGAVGWYTDSWLDEVMNGVTLAFDLACERWRSLYRAAWKQREIQNRIIGDATRSQRDKNQARRLRREAEAQLELLTEAQNVVQSDFYSYRYFASEGFLPGYNFPRLPLSAYIPGRQRLRGRDEFLSRPRFLAISEFGPRAVVYHEGSRYLINRVILPVRDEEKLSTASVKLCGGCGYLHPIWGDAGPDLCERCGRALPQALGNLFRLQNVATKRHDKINSDEEERLRLGYELRTGVRFPDQMGIPAVRTAEVVDGEGQPILRLTYGHAGTLWRINLGWARRRERNQYGFVLDTERGFWARNDQLAEDEDEADPLSARTLRVIPYVEDRRNCLLLEPTRPEPIEVMASLQAAIKNAIQIHYQLEDNELAADPLPSPDDRRVLLVYEAAEGGAGVLRRLVDDPKAMGEVARQALELCHFDPARGADRRRAPRAREDCEAACYDCLMTYTNQGDHELLDRQRILPILQGLASATVRTSPAPVSRAQHMADLMRLAGTELERRWLRFLDERRLRLPSRAQPLVEECGTRPDFLYDKALAAVYIDGPVHDYPDRHERDRAQTACMEDLGYTVIRFHHADEWEGVVARYPHIFGAQR